MTDCDYMLAARVRMSCAAATSPAQSIRGVQSRSGMTVEKAASAVR